MIALIVATHGSFAEEIIKSGEMIFGQQQNIKAVTFIPGEGPEELEDKLRGAVDSLDTSDEVLFLVDLFGGSPYNAASKLAVLQENMDIVTGVNLPMVISAFSGRETMDLNSLVASIKEESIIGIKSLKEVLKNVEEDDL